MHSRPDLESVIRDLDRHVSTDGWEQPPRLFALVDEASGFSVVEQAWQSSGESVLGDLSAITWPPEVTGAALSVQRVLEPDHEVRLTVAALRTQEVTTALRYKAYDSDDAVAIGSGVIPRLERALWDTLQ